MKMNMRTLLFNNVTYARDPARKYHPQSSRVSACLM